MNFKDFNNYKKQFRVAIRKTLAKAETGSLDEAAFPAYAHKNPLINFLFWERIRKVINYLEPASPYNAVMDFGSGSGVLLPFLSRICIKVVAIDIDLSPLEKIKQYIAFPPNIEYYNSRTANLESFPQASFDVIIALDVLEHVDNLQKTLAPLCKLLTPNGKIIISGPTENLLYKVGRVFAGPEYTGDYHKRNIYQIKEILSSMAKVKHIATLYYPVPFFEIFYGTV